MSATTAALTAAVAAAAVALPAAASTGTSSGGASATPPPEQPYDPPPGENGVYPAEDGSYHPAMATWYGPGFFGRRTACGAKLTRQTLGVAHKRLACGTKIAIEYRGRTVVVPVIDRGPFSRGVDYDLTYATARRLGMLQKSQVHAAALRPGP